ncbi:hypothetical protein PEC301645_11980 [Pectobacterium carotovorum subsp. carotovorum]|nr:hypothetical protein PEC301645_11980 [Pectobacterium carotovorum subsp. carotovorum]
MDSFTLEDRFNYQPLTNSQGEIYPFGVRIEPKQSGVHIGELSPNWLRILVESLSNHDRSPAFGGHKDSFNAIANTPITSGVMKVFEFSFLCVGNKYLHRGCA